jgi:hypothetical protein
MEQRINRRRRQFLIFSGIATGSLLLAPLLTKLNLLEETLRVNVGTRENGGGYGASTYGGTR